MYNMSKRDALLATTKELMSRHGFQAVSPRKILDESGAGQGSLYHHFRGKVDLAGSALGELSDEMQREFDEVLAEAVDAFSSLNTYLEIDRDALGGCRVGRLAHEDAIELPEIREPVAAYFEHVEAGLTNAVVEACNRGRLQPASDPTEIAAALVAIVQGGYVLARVHQDPDAMYRALRGAAAMLRSLEPDQPPPRA